MTEASGVATHAFEPDRQPHGWVDPPMGAGEIKRFDVPEIGVQASNPPRPRKEVRVRGPCSTRSCYYDEKPSFETMDGNGWLPRVTYISSFDVDGTGRACASSTALSSGSRKVSTQRSRRSSRSVGLPVPLLLSQTWVYGKASEHKTTSSSSAAVVIPPTPHAVREPCVV